MSRKSKRKKVGMIYKSQKFDMQVSEVDPVI